MIGGRIKELRDKEPQKNFGKRFGVSRNTIQRYESGERKPDSDFITALCEEYNVTADWLVIGKGEMRPWDNGKVNLLEDPLIKDIKLWIRDMTSEYPGWKTWFETELLQKIPQFAEWRKKNQPGDSNEKIAAS